MPDELTRKQIDNNNVFFNQIEQNGEYIPFGSNDEDVQMYWNNAKSESLHDAYQAWRTFIGQWDNFTSNAQFIHMGNEPSSTNVKIWFDTSNSSENSSNN